MTDQKSPADIERHAEDVREQMAGTAESLRERLSPGQLVDEVGHYLRHSDGAMGLSNLQRQARDNPMALALVGAGLAWLMLGSGTRTSSRVGGYDPARRTARSHTSSSTMPAGRPGDGFEAMDDDRDHSLSQSVSDTAADIGDTARSYASSMRGGAASMGESTADFGSRVADSGRDFADSVSSAAGRAASGSRDAARSARDSFGELLEREPLIVGAIGLAVGAALGALAPRTEVEDEYLGAAGDRVKRSAARAAHAGLDEARHVAEESYDAGKAALRRDEGDAASSAAKPV